MAALSDRLPDSLVELHDLTGGQIADLLEEEIAQWRTDLDWDFRASADLVRRFVEMRALTGYALLDGTRVAGYAYYVVEDGKGLIGDLYVRAGLRTTERENLLLATVLDAVWKTRGASRVEAQLLMMGSVVGRPVPEARFFRSYPRLFLEAPLKLALSLEARPLAEARIVPWSESRQDEAAQVIATAYVGHIDGQINDQYRSSAGARRFLTNIVQYPGCGSFFSPASYLAEERIPGPFSGGAPSGRKLSEGTLCGLCLASLVADGVGHITQVCVSPEHQATGLGYELLRRSLLSLAARGCRSVSLTVTAANQQAIRLYERMGFRTRRSFAAYVWEKR
jgi:ribosomal protein S18 acetylase RimI-like enzyme